MGGSGGRSDEYLFNILSTNLLCSVVIWDFCDVNLLFCGCCVCMGFLYAHFSLLGTDCVSLMFSVLGNVCFVFIA